ncbi:MAG TPA: hypothetical protein DCX32_02720 [Candidatus Moranbacteria bacterium]|nr:hypothetical protein [Candidatus Moranbacteria bacterium]
MKEIKKITDNNSFFVDFSLFWVIFGWLALVLTLLDFFYAWIFFSFFAAGAAYFLWTVAAKKRKLKLSRNFILVNVALAAFVAILSFFTTPTVFTGTDQGSISNAPILLSENHQLRFSMPVIEEFFGVYGPGKALNFPGFHYTAQGELTTQFPLGYISWLGAFHSMFGLSGLVVANSVALFLFFLSFYMVGRKMLKRRYALLMMLFALTSFSFAWFSKFTLSENLALALLWMMVASVIYLVQTPGKKTLLLFVLASTLLIFTRIEGYAFFVTSALVLLLNKESRVFLKRNRRFIIVSAASFLLVFAVNLYKDMPFFREIGKASIGSFFETGDDGKVVVKSLLSPGVRITQIYVLYGLAGFFLVGFFSMVCSFWKKRYDILIPLFVVFPSFLYLIDSNISSDHPWMLRRFVFAILPVFIFYSAHLFKHLLEKNPGNSRHPLFLRYMAITLFVILVALNLKSFGRYAFFSENKGLLEQTQKLSEKFSDRDLILIDRLSSGDGWSLLAGPMRVLHGKQAAYFFNVSDLRKIDLQKFDDVYIITSEENIPFYASTEIGEKLSVEEKYTITTTRLVEQQKKDLLPIVRFPKKENVETEGYILKLEK